MSLAEPDTTTDREPITEQAVTINILKGGEGKSSLALNIADRLSVRGYDVLFVDLDPNGHITRGLEFDEVYNDPTHDLANTVIHEHTPPEEWTYETDWEWDFLPASQKHGALERSLQNSADLTLLRDNLIQPFFDGGAYDYIITDGGGEYSMIGRSTYVATGQTMLPVTPGVESMSGLRQTFKRIINPIQEKINLDVLAVIPNRISNRIDYQYADRELLEKLNRSEKFSERVPNFARITPEQWDRIDNGEVDELPKPGVRESSAFHRAYQAGKPVGRHDPDAAVLDQIDELADIVEYGGINRA